MLNINLNNGLSDKWQKQREEQAKIREENIRRIEEEEIARTREPIQLLLNFN